MSFSQTLSHRLLLFLLALSLSPARAQDAADTSAPNFTTRELEALANLPKIPERQKRLPGELAFAVFSFGQDGEDFFYLRDGKPERVFFNTGVVRRFQFGGDESGLTLYKRAKNPEGEFKFKPVGRATPPNGSRDGIILFHPTEKKATAESAGSPVRCLIYKDSGKVSD